MDSLAVEVNILAQRSSTQSAADPILHRLGLLGDDVYFKAETTDPHRRFHHHESPLHLLRWLPLLAPEERDPDNAKPAVRGPDPQLQSLEAELADYRKLDIHQPSRSPPQKRRQIFRKYATLASSPRDPHRCHR